jgi:hypothetical protein
MTTPKVREITRGTAHPAGDVATAPKGPQLTDAGAQRSR